MYYYCKEKYKNIRNNIFHNTTKHLILENTLYYYAFNYLILYFTFDLKLYIDHVILLMIFLEKYL